MNRGLLYLLLTGLLLGACTKEYSYEGGPTDTLPPIAGADSLYYFQALLEDSSYSEAIVRPFGLARALSFEHGPDINSGLVLSAWIEPNRNDDSTELDILAIERGIIMNSDNLDSSQFASYFLPGTQVLGELFRRSLAVPVLGRHGFVVQFFQLSTGMFWRSDFGSGDQTGSYFTIRSVTPATGPPNYYCFRVEMEFGCILYNEAGDSSLRILKGRAAYWYAKKK